jgi:ribosome-associated protein
MREFSSEIFYRTARSGGKGGQNVNKVETMVEAWWHVNSSRLFLPEEKELIHDKLKNRVNKDGYLIVKCSETRSQLENKLIVLEKIQDMVTQSLIRPKKRKATRPSKAAKERRLAGKRIDSEKKQMRKKDW